MSRHEVHVPSLLPPTPSIPKPNPTFSRHFFFYTVGHHGRSLCITLVVLSLRWCANSSFVVSSLVARLGALSLLDFLLSLLRLVCSTLAITVTLYMFFLPYVVVVGRVVMAHACWLVPIWISG